MKETKLLKYLFVLIIWICTFILFRSWQIQKNYANLRKKHEVFQQNMEEIMNFYIKKDTLQFLSENINLKPNLRIENTDGELIMLNKIFDGRKIVFRFFEFNCNACYESSYASYKEMINRVGRDNALLLADYQNERNLYVFMRINDFRCEVYNTKGVELNLEIDKNRVPYFFIVDKNMKVTNVYAIGKIKANELVPKYLNHVYTKYFDFEN